MIASSRSMFDDVSISTSVLAGSYALTRPSLETIGWRIGTSELASMKASGTSWVTN